MGTTRTIRKSILVRVAVSGMAAIVSERANLEAWWGSVPAETETVDADGRLIWATDNGRAITILNNQLPDSLLLFWPLRDEGFVRSTVKISLSGRRNDALGEAQDVTVVTVEHEGIPDGPEWDETWQDYACGWVTELVHMQLWAERGLTRAEATDPARYAIVEKELEIRARPSEVYGALTDSALLGKWMDAKASVDPVPGGLMEVRWHSGERVGGEVVLVDEGAHIVWHWWDAEALATGRDDVMITVVTWHLIPFGNGTILRMVDAGYDRAVATDGFLAEIHQGWATMTSRIEGVLGKGL